MQSPVRRPSSNGSGLTEALHAFASISHPLPSYRQKQSCCDRPKSPGRFALVSPAWPDRPRENTIASRSMPTLRLVTGLWNLALCYERGLGVARDPLAAQALQQQCRDQERENQLRRGPSVVGAVALGVGARSGRRSSEPLAVSGPNPTKRWPKPRLRSSSVPTLTPPRPQGSPPGRATKLDRRQYQIPEKAEFEEPAAVPIGSSGHKNVRNEDPSIGRRPSVSVGRTAAESAAEGTAVAASASLDISDRISPSPLERKDSLLLKPTPLAIARVKAAVERRRRQELVGMSSAVADGLGGGK